jgi:hypothetical protein
VLDQEALKHALLELSPAEKLRQREPSVCATSGGDHYAGCECRRDGGCGLLYSGGP